ncbi:MAG: pyrroline-5-carboxylate reductase [Planctomycetes bacterium]|nr:pyrroline-5-carboxylate reductase [Planctomycetota bacterium]
MASLAVAGFGKLGSAIVRGAIDAGVVAPHEIMVWARSDARRTQAEAWGLRRAEWPTVLRASRRVLLALKPQVFGTMTAERPVLEPGATFLSVMGGWQARDIGLRMGTDRVIRAMPSVAAAVGASVTALAVPAGMDTEDADFARRLLGAVGRVIEMPESMFDAATAVGASGVGFACLFVEALESAAVQAGMDPAAARELAVGAVAGAGRCLQASGEAPERLREQVTSPAGTTAAGVQALQAGGFGDLVRMAVDAARARAEQLGRTQA